MVQTIDKDMLSRITKNLTDTANEIEAYEKVQQETAKNTSDKKGEKTMTLPLLASAQLPCKSCIKSDVCIYKERAEKLVSLVNQDIVDCIEDTKVFEFGIKCNKCSTNIVNIR